MKIRFNRPYLTGNELKYIKNIIDRRLRLGSDGFYAEKVTHLLQKNLNAKKIFLTTSGTTALEMAGQLLELKPKDEIIIPSFTFPSTANAILLNCKIKLRFAEIQQDTLNIDPADIIKRLNRKTRAIIVMHYAGVSCDMGKIMAIAKRFHLKIIEDAAHSIGSKYNDQFLGTIGDFGCFSFHESKNITCGEGGALSINSLNKNLIEKAEIIREKGTNRLKFVRGEIDKYTWVDRGSSSAPSDILAAFLYAQVKRMFKINKMRMEIFKFYRNSLSQFEKKGLVRLPIIPNYASHNAHIFYILFNNEKARDYIQHSLRKKGVECSFHFLPLHLSIMGRHLGYKPGDFPKTEKASKCLLRLPLYAGMKKQETVFVVDVLAKLLGEL